MARGGLSRRRLGRPLAPSRRVETDVEVECGHLERRICKPAPHPRCRRLAVRERLAAPGPHGGRLPPGGHLRALSPHGREPRADGLRQRPARHADHRPRRQRRHARRRTIVERFHPSSSSYWDALGISFDLFTTTGTENHDEVVHDFFMRLLRARATSTRQRRSSSSTRRRSASCPTATSRAPARTAATSRRAATSATTAAARSTRST